MWSSVRQALEATAPICSPGSHWGELDCGGETVSKMAHSPGLQVGPGYWPRARSRLSVAGLCFSPHGPLYWSLGFQTVWYLDPKRIFKRLNVAFFNCIFSITIYSPIPSFTSFHPLSSSITTLLSVFMSFFFFFSFLLDPSTPPASLRRCQPALYLWVCLNLFVYFFSITVYIQYYFVLLYYSSRYMA